MAQPANPFRSTRFRWSLVATLILIGIGLMIAFGPLLNPIVGSPSGGLFR
jgi:hypothetical protein